MYYFTLLKVLYFVSCQSNETDNDIKNNIHDKFWFISCLKPHPSWNVWNSRYEIYARNSMLALTKRALNSFMTDMAQQEFTFRLQRYDNVKKRKSISYGPQITLSPACYWPWMVFKEKVSFWTFWKIRATFADLCPRIILSDNRNRKKVQW